MGLKNNVKNSVSADCQYHSEIGNQFKYNSSEMNENDSFLNIKSVNRIEVIKNIRVI